MAHTLHFDDGAGDFNHNRLVGIFTRKGEGDGGAGFAAHFFYCFAHVHTAGGCAVDFHNQVAAFHAGALGRGVFNRRHHFDKAVFRAHFHAQTAEFAAGGFFQVGIVFKRHVFGMRVEAGHHAFHGAFDQLVVFFVLVVIGFNLAVNFGHGADGLHRQRFVGFVFIGGQALHAQAEYHAAERAEGVEGDFFQSGFCHGFCFLFSACGRLSDGLRDNVALYVICFLRATVRG